VLLFLYSTAYLPAIYMLLYYYYLLLLLPGLGWAGPGWAGLGWPPPCCLQLIADPTDPPHGSQPRSKCMRGMRVALPDQTRGSNQTEQQPVGVLQKQ
jgi:hypothetical protein